MTLYEYRCRSCGRTREETTSDAIQPCPCGGLSKRDYSSVSIRSLTAFRPHFNPSVGKFVRTEAQFKSELNRCADNNSLLTGTDHKYEPVDFTDVTPHNDAMTILDEKAHILEKQR